MSDPLDMTGAWFGRYAYPAGTSMPPVSFIANLDDKDGAISGAISEPNTFQRGRADHLRAVVSGHRHGTHVDFTKCYDGADVATHAIEYHGTLGNEGLQLEGSWLLGGMIGSFQMHRTRPAADLEATRTARTRAGETVR